MRINQQHRSWFVLTGAVTAAAAVLYWRYATARPYGPSGGSWQGLTFGVIATLLMIGEGLLAVRKHWRTVRIGSARLWMRLHIWLGLLAVPFVLFHAGFSLGGPLTTALMLLFLAVVGSGIYGLVLQQFVPGQMTERVPLETVHSQIPHVRMGLTADAYEIVSSVAGRIETAREEQQWIEAERRAGWKTVVRREPAATPGPGADALRAAYVNHIRPYLRRAIGDEQAPPDLHTLTIEAPPEVHPKIERLRELCEQSRQLDVQLRLHNRLHAWLFIHAPLSFALYGLVAFHIYHALRY